MEGKPERILNLSKSGFERERAWDTKVDRQSEQLNWFIELQLRGTNLSAKVSCHEIDIFSAADINVQNKSMNATTNFEITQLVLDEVVAMVMAVVGLPTCISFRFK